MTGSPLLVNLAQRAEINAEIVVGKTERLLQLIHSLAELEER